MIPSPALCRRLTGLVIGFLPLCGCSRGEPVVVHRAIDPAAMVTAEETLSKSFKTGATPKIVVDVFNGPISITPAAEGLVKATVTKRAGGKTKAEAEEALKELTVTVTEEMEGIRIAALPPRGKPFSGGASAKVEVPAGASLELKTSLDQITVTGIDGAIRANSAQGPIVIKNSRGILHLTTSLGKIDVDAASSQVTARNSQGAIVVRNATGALDLGTSLGMIDVNAPCTQVTAKNSQGAIVIRGATGALDLGTSLGTIDVDAPCTKVTANNSQGAITVKGATGPLKLTTNLANILVHAAGAELEAVNSQGAIDAHGVKGRVKAKTSLNNLTIEARDAVVDAENSQGAVTFSGSLATGKHLFRTTLGNVEMTLPAEASFRVSAEVSLGKINNSFALKQTEKSSKTRLIGTVGDAPGATIHVSVSQGDVTINKAR